MSNYGYWKNLEIDSIKRTILMRAKTDYILNKVTPTKAKRSSK